MYIRIILLFLFISCSSTRDGFLGQLPDNFIESFDVEDSSITKFMDDGKKKSQEESPVLKEAISQSSKKTEEKNVAKKEPVKEDPKVVELKKSYKKLDHVSSKLWKKFKLVVTPGEKYFFSVYFWGIRVGTVKVEVEKDVTVAEKPAYHISGQLRSAKFYEYIYSFDDRLDSYIEKTKFVPLKYVLRQRESKQDVDDLQLFDHDKKKTYFLYKRLKEGKTKKRQKTQLTPNYFQDTFSSFFFMRGLPLKVGDFYEFPIMTRGKVKGFKIKVKSIDTIEVFDQDVQAIRLEASTFLPGVLKEKKKKKSKNKITFWFSNTPEHRFLKVEASVKLGSVSGELIGYCPAQGECEGSFEQ